MALITPSILSIPLLKHLHQCPQHTKAQSVGYTSLPPISVFNSEDIYLPRQHTCLFPNLLMSITLLLYLHNYILHILMKYLCIRKELFLFQVQCYGNTW